MTEPIFVLDQDDDFAHHFAALHPKILRSQADVCRAFEANRRRALWIAPTAGAVRSLAALRSARRGDQRLLLLGHTDGSRHELLRALFRVVVAPENGVKLLPGHALADVLAAPNRDDLFIGGVVDVVDRALVLYRGNLESLIVPLSWFSRRDHPRVEAGDFEVIDGGQTIRLGKLEAASDAILYELDPDARRRAKQRLLAKDASLGGSLRRLRKQRGLRRADFEGVSSKEIARIERGEVAKPHKETLATLAQRLGVRPSDIGTF